MKDDTTPEPGKEIQKQAAPDPTTQCPACRAQSIIHAKLHCNGPKCNWRICACGTTWNRGNGSFYPPVKG